jgi:uncharacterized protein (TIGR03905 family)
MKYQYTPQGTCSRLIEFEMENGVVSNLCVTGGCNGNLQGIAALCNGRKATDIVASLRGIRCGMKPTSCPDQIAQAIESALEEN